MDPHEILSSMNVYPIFVDDIEDPETKAFGHSVDLPVFCLVKLDYNPENKSIQAVRRRRRFEITNDKYVMDRIGLECNNGVVHFESTINRGPEDFISNITFSYTLNERNFNLTIKNITLKVCEEEYPVDIENFTVFVCAIKQHHFRLDYYFTFNETIPDNARIFVDYVATTVNGSEYKELRNKNFTISSNGLMMNDLYEMYNSFTKEKHGHRPVRDQVGRNAAQTPLRW